MMRKLLILFTWLLMIVISSCSSDGDETTPTIDDPEALPEEELVILENLNEAVGYDYSTVVLPNGEILSDFLLQYDPGFVNGARTNSNPFEGLGPQAARNLLIARMNKVAIDLTDRTKHQYSSEGSDKPAQNGIAYSWGRKDHTIRQKPVSSSTCSYQIYGLDCSGFIHQLFVQAGVNVKTGPADDQRNPQYLESVIKSSIPELDKVKVEDLGAIPTSEFESGDLIYWTNSAGKATHIGMILKKGGGDLAVFQSNGSPGYNDDDCANNLSSTRGVRSLELSDPYWFGSAKTYGITRINADLSGSWSLYLRCAGQTVDALSFNLEFPTSSDNTFEVTGTGTDYDGSPFNCSINMTYNNATNELSGNSYITKPSAPDFYRNDSFTVKLNKDETDYFSWTLGDSQNAGCDLEARLVNDANESGARLASDESRTINNKVIIGLK